MRRAEQSPIDDRQLINAGFRYAMSLAHNEHDAEDLIQQACLKTLRSRGNLVGKSYLFVVIRNLFFDGYRRAERAKQEQLSSCIPDDAPSHIRAVDGRIDLERILGCLRPEEREALFLNCVEGHTAEEISRLTNQPRSTILSHLSRAKKRLAERHDRDEVF